MNIKLYINEDGVLITRQELEIEFQILKANQETEQPDFDSYLDECLSKNGTLTAI